MQKGLRGVAKGSYLFGTQWTNGLRSRLCRGLCRRLRGRLCRGLRRGLCLQTSALFEGANDAFDVGAVGHVGLEVTLVELYGVVEVARVGIDPRDVVENEDVGEDLVGRLELCDRAGILPTASERETLAKMPSGFGALIGMGECRSESD